MRVITTTSLAFIASSLFGFATGAFAEEESQLLEDLTSEVRYEEEQAQWVPYSVTVLTRDELENNYRRDLEDIEGRVPGLIVDRLNTTPRGAAIALRGFGSAHAAKSFDPAVAINVDGVYIGTHTGRMQVLFDFEKIEVARGPQGTLDADPNIAGSINIQRARPTGELDADVRASFGIDGRREADVILNFPVVEGLNGKLAIYRQDSGGEYMRNVLNNRNENTEDYTFLSTSFDWEFGDLFTMAYTFDRENSDETTPALLNISGPDDLLCSATSGEQFPNCRRGVGNPELDSLRTTAQNYSNDREFEGDYHTLRFDFDLLDHEVTSITAHRSTDEYSDLDVDASNADFYHVSQTQDYNQFSQEFRVRGTYSEALSYQFGVYYLNTEYDIEQQEHHILKQLGDAGFSAGHAAGEIQELTSSQDSHLQSYFAGINYIINDQWIADASARWTEVNRDLTHSPSRIRLGNTISPLRTLLDSEETTKQLLISGGLAYKVDEEAMIYMRYNEGFLPGGFDENAMSAVSANSYGAETSRSAEVGLKSDWWDDRLRVNFVFYRTELDNKVERFDAFVDTDRIESLLDNRSEIDLAGWELELESIPLDNLHLRLIYSHINTDYDKYTVPDLNNPGSFVNLSNLLPTYAPDDNLFVSAMYSIPYGPGTIHTYAGYRLFSDYQTYTLLPEAKVNNWTSWDLSVSYEWNEWVFRLFSNNVKNKEFIQNIRQVTQTSILPVNSGQTSVPSLITFTEYNQPRYTGLEIIYTPNF